MIFDSGYLYITARKAHQIYKVLVENGEVSLMAGTGIAGYRDGAALDSQFNYPFSLAVSATDPTFIYVNEVAITAVQDELHPTYVRGIQRYK